MGKIAYKVTNWKEYNASLRRRGDLTLWIDPAIQEVWCSPPKTTGRGRKASYHPKVFEMCNTIRYLLGLPFRQTQGFMQGLMKLSKLSLPIPDYSYLCKKACTLSSCLDTSKRPTSIAIDATGIRVSGEGEWLVRKHMKSKRRKWLKIHLSVNTGNHEITAVKLTDPELHDSQVFEEIIPDQTEVIYADGAYDTFPCHAKAKQLGAHLVAPPRSNAVLGRSPDPGEEEHPRDELILMQELLGESWKEELGYGKRNHGEGAFSRLKRIFGGSLASKKKSNQHKEIRCKIRLLNQFTRIGMPISIPVI